MIDTRTPYEDICDNPMTEGLLNNDSIIFEKRTLRVWKHNKGKLNGITTVTVLISLMCVFKEQKHFTYRHPILYRFIHFPISLLTMTLRKHTKLLCCPHRCFTYQHTGSIKSSH